MEDTTDKKSGLLRSASLENLILISGAAFFYSLVFELPATPFFWESDHLIFAYEGWRMYLGDTMYRDFFQFTFPGSQLYYAVMFSIFGAKHWIINATIVALATAILFLTLRLSKSVIEGPFAYLPALLFAFFGFRWFGIDGSHRMFSPVFILLAALIVIRSRKPLNLILAGVFCGITSFFTQQRGFFAVCAIALFILIEGIVEKREFFGIGKDIFYLGAAAVISLAALCAYFVFAAGPELFWESAFVYPSNWYGFSKYNNSEVFFLVLGRAASFTNLSGAFAFVMHLVYSFGIPLVYPLFALAFFFRISRDKWNEWKKVVLIALIGFATTYSNVAPDSFRLFQVSSPALILVGFLISRITLAKQFDRWLVTAAAAGLLLLSLYLGIRMQTNWEMVYWQSPSGKLAVFPVEQIERYTYVLENTEPGEEFFEVYEPYIYFPFHLRNPTRYGQIWETDYTRPEHVAEVVSDLEKSRPGLMLWDVDYNRPDDQRRSGDHLAPLARFVQQNYEPVGKVYQVADRRIQVWKLKADD
ncbi:MAG: hypothetical protein DWQ47_12470 [Acidobacteria bacterium]|nr:MAG: hypothetical protein DWQ32_14885 [Acidobacteriota bacterium]REJ98382.1 MAG: hypothetical protein DWQ38_17685 [Acidobacteriota bacterium]REK17126.1 MAG: hypothetical protein DWQ43_02730 [Acidobacteriota bacterium]REK43036.1 MAG: hypothetical protein DWQ47_12470 [Acidobacteriota bacterium]